MKDLRKNFERFCLKNRDRGIPNLMLVIAIGNLIAYALSVIDPSRVVYRFLCFSPSKILHGQIWRLFTYVFTYLLDVSGSYLFPCRHQSVLLLPVRQDARKLLGCLPL